uniref:Metalloendopeptidase n=1 Tax=Strongyloides venezuelensis TaxID=75913 RepID=A0A0K0G429_STRVS
MKLELKNQLSIICNLNGLLQLLISEALEILQKETCLRFNYTLNFTNAVLRYVNGSNRCYSYLGKFSNDDRYNVVVGRDCSYIMGVLHETLHTIGVIHEMARHDRDSYIDVKCENIKSASQHNFDRYDLGEASPFDLKCDFGSVMYYNRYQQITKKQWYQKLSIKVI